MKISKKSKQFHRDVSRKAARERSAAHAEKVAHLAADKASRILDGAAS